jgi:hypothetical protein
MEYILCAAIWIKNERKYEHQPENIPAGYVLCGRRHEDIMYLSTVLIKSVINPSTSEKGFVTSKNRFVNRLDATEIAILAGQVPIENKGAALTSQELY